MHRSLVQQVAELVEVVLFVGEVRQAVECRLVSLVRQCSQGLAIRSYEAHGADGRPCPRGRVKREDGDVLTIGGLARYTGVTVKAIRVYHAKGLLAEPPRDASGYRRYGAQHVIDLIKIRTLAEAGVPLARIHEIRTTSADEAGRALREVDDALSAKIGALAETQRRLRRLASGELPALPAQVSGYLERLASHGFSARWVAMLTDLWILTFRTHPDAALALFADQADAAEDPEQLQIFLDYDRAFDLDPDDPRIDELATRIVAATRARYSSREMPELPSSDIPTLVQEAVTDASPAWRRLDLLVRRRLP
jgi:DNA-binding transcriptional MerR regulator